MGEPALDAILAKWNVEAGWPAGVTLAQAKIGWVAGTHLMGGFYKGRGEIMLLGLVRGGC